VLAAVSMALGCATPAMRDVSVKVVPERLVAVPTDGVEWEFDAAGNQTISEEGTAAAIKNVDDSISYRLSLQGGHALEREEFEEFRWSVPFREWSQRMMREIMSERLGRSLTKHESVGEWHYGRALASFRDRLAADFLLVSMFLDGHNTAGRSIGVALGGGYLAARRAIACIVRLEDGRVVWCNLTTIAWDLQQRSGAQGFANSLLLEVLGQPAANGK
jgi:hypothetical protein